MNWLGEFVASWWKLVLSWFPLIAFGLWALLTGARLLFGILTFRENKAEFESLKREIEEATMDLQAKGVNMSRAPVQ